MDKDITLVVKSHYGVDHFYVTSGHCKAIQQLTGHLTVTRQDIASLKGLGFGFVVENLATV